MAAALTPSEVPTPHAALTQFLEHLANERRASPRTVEAYRAAGLSNLRFHGQHFGGSDTLAELGSLSAGDIRCSWPIAAAAITALGAFAFAVPLGGTELPSLPRPAARRPTLPRRWPWCAARRWSRRRHGR